MPGKTSARSHFNLDLMDKEGAQRRGTRAKLKEDTACARLRVCRLGQQQGWVEA